MIYSRNQIAYSDLSTQNTEDFASSTQGKELLMMNSETDLFTPINIAGFRSIFYTFFDIGWLSSEDKLFNRNSFYTGLGLGFRLRNDFLVFNTIDIRLAWYPQLPQTSFGHYLDVITTSPSISPSFVTDYPKVISIK